MIPSVVKEPSGLLTIKSTLYMQPTKADKDSVFRCMVEYSMPGEQIKQKKSDTININLNCEWRRARTHSHIGAGLQTAFALPLRREKKEKEIYSRFRNHGGAAYAIVVFVVNKLLIMPGSWWKTHTAFSCTVGSVGAARREQISNPSCDLLRMSVSNRRRHC